MVGCPWILAAVSGRLSGLAARDGWIGWRRSGSPTGEDVRPRGRTTVSGATSRRCNSTSRCNSTPAGGWPGPRSGCWKRGCRSVRDERICQSFYGFDTRPAADPAARSRIRNAAKASAYPRVAWGRRGGEEATGRLCRGRETNESGDCGPGPTNAVGYIRRGARGRGRNGCEGQVIRG